MGKKKGARSGAAAASADGASRPPSPPSLWYVDEEGWRLTPCTLQPKDVLQVSCSHHGGLAMVLNDGRLALCDTGQAAGAAGQGSARKAKYVAVGKMKIISLECGRSSMLLVSAEGKLYEYEYTVSSLQPCLVKTLNDKQIVQVACGDHHSMALSKGGELFTWGQNMHGQLGLKFRPPRQSTPQLVEHLIGSPLAQITAGGAHSIALSLSGTVYSWGNNNAGQLGLGDMQSRYLPTIIKTLERKRTEFISCGDEHTAALTKDGLVFTFGAGIHGQLGHKGTGNKLLPCLLDRLREVHVFQVACGSHHTLAYVPSQSEVYFFGAGACGPALSNETCGQTIKLPIQESEVDLHEGNSSQERIFKVVAGGNQSIVLSLNETLANRCIDRRIATIEADMVEKWLEVGNSDWRQTKKEIKQIFSSVACVNGSFLKHRDKRSKTQPKILGIDRGATARLFFEKIANREPVVQQIGSSLKKCLIPQLTHLPPHTDALAIFLLLPEFFLMYEAPDSVPLLASFANAVNVLGHYALKILEKWWSALPPLCLYKHVNMLKKAVVSKLKSGHITQQDHLNTTSILEMLEKMYKANMKANYKLPIEEFYINEICTIVDLGSDVRKWQMSKQKPQGNETLGHVIFCQYPFLLNLLGKRQMLQFDLDLKQEVEIIKACTQFYKMMQGSREIPKIPIFHLMVNGPTLVEDTLRVLSTTEDCDLRKQLVLTFVGLFPCANPIRVFFLHVFEELLQPDYGMFVQCAKFSPLWFPAKPPVNTKKYSMFGILCGLTIFNCDSMYLPFPLALFKKLLGQHPTLEDLKELDPVKGKNLQYVLDYEDDDIVDNLDICFIATWDNKTVDLIENGSDISVDNSNKHDYVNKYVDYIFNISASTMFEEFKSGFYKVCEKTILQTFQPSELMGVLIGNADYDWEKFEQIAEYEGIFKQRPSHPTIKIFWEVFHELSLSEKKQFLLFVVGSETIPVYGMNCLKILISSNPAFTEAHLPQAKTCFQILVLPPYSTKPILKEKLLLAISHNRGFV